MNNSDQVVGGATTADGSVHAFLWTLGEDKRGIIRDLGTLGGRNSFATAINEAGQVVGYSETGDLYREEGIAPVPVWHAFLWDERGDVRSGGSQRLLRLSLRPALPVQRSG